METVSENNNNITKIIKILNRGGLIIYPTETAYGVGVDATNKEAVKKLLKYKNRPEGKAISIACSDEQMASEYVQINDSAKNLYKNFLPGPVTVISKSKNKVDSKLESENGNLGIRIPDYKFILNLIEEFGRPITATSANSSGKKTPYSITDILENISDKQKSYIDLIIDAGQLPKRLPSTVIDTTTDDLKVYRKGKKRLIANGKESYRNKSQMTKYKTKNVTETIKLGQKLMSENIQAKKPVIFLLSGDLGAGKTHLTKGIAKALGIERTIKSPTYTYVEEYRILRDQIPPLEGRSGGVIPASNYHYNKSLKPYARENRKKQTPAESLLWSKLRNKQLLELRFLRQRVINKYIVDFFQPDTNLIIELDGASHDEKKYEYDISRERQLEALGYKFLRFTEYEVRTRLNDVLETIYMYCEKTITHPSPPSREGIETEVIDRVDFSAPPLERGLGGVISKLYHIDAWKISSIEDLEELGFESWIKPGNILVIEWPEVIENLTNSEELFKNAKVIRIEIDGKGDEREVLVYN